MAGLPAIDKPGGWEARVLQALGAPWDPDTPAGLHNINLLSAWSKLENTEAAYNPLATTLEMPGATTLAGNPAGVRNYTGPDQGIAATAQTLRGYPTIIRFLRAGQPQSILVTPAGRSELNKWSGHGSTPAYTDYVNGLAQGYYGEKGAGDWTSFDIKGAAAGIAKGVTWVGKEVGGLVLRPVEWAAHWLEGVGAKALAYLVLTVLALGLIGMGLGQAFGISPLSLARMRGSSKALAGGGQTEEIPF